MSTTIRKYYREGSFFNIPKDGDIMPLKFVCTEYSKYGANLSADNYVGEGSRFIRTTDIDDDGRLSSEGVFIDTELVSEYDLKSGDFLISRSGTLGRSYLYNINHGKCSYAGYLVRYRLNETIVNPRFIFYTTKTFQFFKWLDYSVIEATIGNINGEKYANLPLPIPSLANQNSIVDRLDKELLTIDSLINMKNHLIKMIQEKKQALINYSVTIGLNSNGAVKKPDLTWLPKYSKDWKVVKLKYLTKIRYGLSQPPTYLDAGTPFIRATNVFRGRISPKDMVYVDADLLNSSKKVVLHEGDIIIVRSGAYTADSAYIGKEYQGSIAGFDMVIRTSHPLSSRFLAYVLLSDYMLNNQLIPMRVRAAQPHLNSEEVGSTTILLPPLDEQKTIVDYLEKNVEHHDNLIEKIGFSIQLLREKRTAVISAAVNGELN